ncbi:MAG: putative baseplate assembly protein [Candidatus Bathyarchaeota archaeon]|nr:putative baseplate assembly protein [Candidatus Termiticorpusculum sp.]
MTENVIKCTAKDRRKQIDTSTLNGIDYIEVVTPGSTVCSNSRPYLIVYFFKALTSSGKNDVKVKLDKNNVKIEGGVKIKNICAEWAMPYVDLFENGGSSLILKSCVNGGCVESFGFDVFSDYIVAGSEEKVLIVCPTCDGDFSTYTLRIVNSLGSNDPLAGFDSLLSSIDFSFKIDCPSKFDCKPVSVSSQEILQEPLIDYLSKDYASFRHLALSRLALLIPDWQERNVADVGIMMVELLAYMGDYLSYYQDAVATEAYLGTSRSRISVKRHARLLDYYMHSGCNSRVWICIEVKSNCAVPKGTKFLTGMGNGSLCVDEADLEKEFSQGTKIFEAMHGLECLYVNHNRIAFHTWGNSDYCLPKGSTQATLYDGVADNKRLLNLTEGDVLIFEEIRSCDGVEADRDVSHRHAVRLKSVKKGCDTLVNPVACVVNVEWGLEDALPFSLCLSRSSEAVAVARGNVLLADHGVSLKAERLVDPDFRSNFRPRLKHGPLTFKGPFDIFASASSVFSYELQAVKADIYLKQLREPLANEFVDFKEFDWLPGKWEPQQDLFASSKFKTDFVVETENDGTAVIRFGDDVHGLNPQTSVDKVPELFYGFYRVGNGVEGNVGSESIKRVVSSNNVFEDILCVRNPMPAKGGVNPESMAMVRQNAPEVAKINERAITDADYADVLKRNCGEIQSAVAKTRWTGSWYTVYVMVDRFGRKPVDEAFKIKVQKVLNRYRLSGFDVEVCGPRYVPLEIEVVVNVSSGSFCEEVEKRLLEVFSSTVLSNGCKGFFHPDNFTFGASLYLRDLYAGIYGVDGVVSFSVKKFRRADKDDGTNLSKGVIRISPYEIIQLDNDANYPENGCITFIMTGGR